MFNIKKYLFNEEIYVHLLSEERFYLQVFSDCIKQKGWYCMQKGHAT